MTLMSKAPVTRRLPDASGALVTYVTTHEAATLLGVHVHTIRKWADMGAIRMLPGLLQNQRHVSVLDATLLATLPPKATLALGIRRTPDDAYKRYRERFTDDQRETLSTARLHRVEWDDFDLGYVSEHYGKVPVMEMAHELGRTFASVTAAIQKLRASGDIPPMHEPRDGAIEDATRLLTAQEVSMMRSI